MKVFGISCTVEQLVVAHREMAPYEDALREENKALFRSGAIDRSAMAKNSHAIRRHIDGLTRSRLLELVETGSVISARQDSA